MKPSCFLFNFILSDNIFNCLTNPLYLKAFFLYLISQKIFQLNSPKCQLCWAPSRRLCISLTYITFLQPIILPLPCLNSFKVRGGQTANSERNPCHSPSHSLLQIYCFHGEEAFKCLREGSKIVTFPEIYSVDSKCGN